MASRRPNSRYVNGPLVGMAPEGYSSTTHNPNGVAYGSIQPQTVATPNYSSGLYGEPPPQPRPSDQVTNVIDAYNKLTQRATNIPGGVSTAPQNPYVAPEGNPYVAPPRGAPQNAWAVPEGYLGPVSSNSTGNSWINRKRHRQWVRNNPNKASAWLNPYGKMNNSAMNPYYQSPMSPQVPSGGYRPNDVKYSTRTYDPNAGVSTAVASNNPYLPQSGNNNNQRTPFSGSKSYNNMFQNNRFSGSGSF